MICAVVLAANDAYGSQQRAQQGYEMVRYADDFVILCRSEAQAHAALAEVQAWRASVGWKLPPTKTRIVDVRQPGGLDFPGYPFEAVLLTPIVISPALGA